MMVSCYETETVESKHQFRADSIPNSSHCRPHSIEIADRSLLCIFLLNHLLFLLCDFSINLGTLAGFIAMRPSLERRHRISTINRYAGADSHVPAFSVGKEAYR